MKIFGNLALLLWSTVYTVVTECVVHASSRRCSGRIRISQPACCTYYVGSMYVLCRIHVHIPPAWGVNRGDFKAKGASMQW